MTLLEQSTLSSKKVIVFDLDGTIVRLTADWHSLVKALNARYYEKNKKKGGFHRISNLLNDIVTQGEEEELQYNFNIIQQYELENIKKTEPIKDVIFFINNRASFGVNSAARLAIFSLNTKATIRKSLEISGLVKEFDFYVGREDVRAWKPEPDGILKIRDFFQVSNEDIIYFGDLKIDLLAGKNAGVDSYIIDDLLKYIRKFKKDSEI